MPNIIQKILISDAGACIRIIIIFYILKWLTLINLPSYMIWLRYIKPVKFWWGLFCLPEGFPEAVTQRCSVKKVSLDISQNMRVGTETSR